MSFSETFGSQYVHWSAHCSLYSGKTRSYLIKKGLEFVEVNPGHPHYTEELLPQIGFFSVPVLETPEGKAIQDTTAIIRFLEENHPQPPMQPAGKGMRALCWLIHNYGTEGLFKPAQHYRWSFPDENMAFIINEFARGLVAPEVRGTPEGLVRAQAYAKAKLTALSNIGVSPETIPAIEASTEKLFEILERHFRQYPYILGGRPSVADCGLMTALHAHLGRDPYPARLMKEQAPALYRWTETMNRPGIVDAELWHVAPEYFELGDLPETLLDFLRLLCADFGPEFAATLVAYNNWLALEPARPAGSLVSVNPDPMLRQSLGKMEHVQQGVTITRDAWPDILFMHQTIMDIVEGMTPDERQEYETLLKDAGGAAFLTDVPARRMVRKGCSIVLDSVE